MNSTAHVRPESEISLEQGVCCAVWGRQTTMQMRANQFLARIQSCSQHAANSQSTTTAKRSTDPVQYQDVPVQEYMYSTATRYEVYIRVQYLMYYADKRVDPYRLVPIHVLKGLLIRRLQQTWTRPSKGVRSWGRETKSPFDDQGEHNKLLLENLA